MEKKLYKSTTDKMVCGVCGGIAEYMNVDSTVVRLVTLGIMVLGGIGILPYLLAAIIMPKQY